jgi:hypothetical protein
LPARFGTERSGFFCRGPLAIRLARGLRGFFVPTGANAEQLASLMSCTKGGSIERSDPASHGCREAGSRCAWYLSRRRGRTVLRIACVLTISLLVARSSSALVVGNVPGTVANTSINPASFPGWTQGDPGWANVSIGGNYVYLGDGWVLSARHVGYSPTAGIQFQTATGPATFYRIPGTHYQDYGYLWTNGDYFYAVSNPSAVENETGQTQSLSEFTDLQLFRINGDPGLPSLSISKQPLTTSNFTRADAPSVVMVGGSGGRSPTQTQWNVTQHSQDDWTWAQTAGVGTHQGYFSDGFTFKRWGTNRLTDIRPNFNEPVDSGAMDYAGIFESVVSDTTAVLKLRTGDGVTRDIIAAMTVYDQQGQPGAPAYNTANTNLEAQAVPGDSGSSVFFKRGNQWELAGIVNATFTYTEQPFNSAVYGNTSMISNLSYYNQNYSASDNALGRFSIKDIIERHADYSMMGDVNLDGIVSGNGTGPTSSDDVTAFIAGWNYNNGLGRGTITSWKNGDLSRDGRTDVYDFLKLRGALNSQVSSGVLAALFGSAAVPEPSTAWLAIFSVALYGLIVRHRRAR